jgi:CubicO group peptidase (beta-lactamase class C family)
LCVYVKGEKVIDLWGSAGLSRDPKYGPDTLQIVFSSTKSVTAICIAILVERGHLDYDEKVTKHWPKFGKNGKENLKLCDILR